MLLVLLFLKYDFLLLFHEFSLLLENSFDTLIDSIFHFPGLYSLVLLIILHQCFKILDFVLLLLNLELILHVLLEEVIDFFGLFVDLDFTLSYLINQLFCFPLQIGNQLHFLNVFFFENFSFDVHFMILVSLNDQSLQKDVDLIRVIQFLEIWFKAFIEHFMGAFNIERQLVIFGTIWADE